MSEIIVKKICISCIHCRLAAITIQLLMSACNADKTIENKKSDSGGHVLIWLFHCLSGSSWADGNLIELARKLGSWCNIAIKVNSTQVRDHQSHPVFL